MRDGSCRQKFLTDKRSEYDPSATVPPATQVNVTGTDAIESILGQLAKANDEMANVIEKSISGAAYWCRLVVRQEVAYASAGNDTEFDAAELLSAVGVAECAGHMSALEIEDAIVKGLRGLRQDGSWSSGQPIFATHRVLGVWPNTSDIAWLLASAVSGTPKLRCADAALMAFVDWLDRTKTDFYLDLTASDDGEAAEHVKGWSGETRESRSIDFWITAGAINALIEIRQIIEYRLWELCEKRFFVFRDLKRLDAIDPVDLGALHEHRLHHRLRRTARESSGPMYRDAEYSFVFHGPPGSSKTVMAEALGNQMWRATAPEPHVIRITPADFTRQGEAGLDAEARFVFELLSHIRGVTIIFDEIDDLLRRRELKGAPEFLKMVVPAMLNRLQDLRDAAPRQEICFIIAMNYVDNIEPALIRPGRIDAAIPVVYPDLWSRDLTLDHAIQDMGAEAVFDDWIRAHIVARTGGWPWPIYKRLTEAIVKNLKESPSPKWEETCNRVDTLVDEIGTQKQDTTSHYAEKVRWQPICPELINEVAHFAFAFFRTRRQCNQQLNKILGSRPKPTEIVTRRWINNRQRWKERVLAVLRIKHDREWDRERRETYNRAAARRTNAMGATHFSDDDGTAFRVWAPEARQVRVLRGPGGEVVTQLRREADNIFADEVRGMSALSEYQYEIDLVSGGDSLVRLDPAARDVNDDGSRNIVIQPSAIRKFEGAGWHELVVYQIHPRTFTAAGTYAAIIDRLEGLEDLGINAIDLIAPGEPVVAGQHGYDWQRFREIEYAYGGRAGLRSLIEAAHARSIAVFIGVTTQELLGRTVADLKLWGSYFEKGSTPLGSRPAMNERHVRELVIENARRWVAEIGVDGIRWAGTQYVRSQADEKGQKRDWAEGLELMKNVRESVRRACPGAMVIAQDDDPPRPFASEDATSAAFNVLYVPAFERAVRDALRDPESGLKRLRNLLERTENDVFRCMISAESAETVRAQGRLSAQWQADQKGRQRAFLATMLSLVTPGIPMLLQGQELWDQPPLDCDVAIPRDADDGLSRRLKALIRLRRSTNGHTQGLTGHKTRIDVQGRVLLVERWIEPPHQPGSGHVVTLLNFGETDERPHFWFPFNGEWHVEFNASATDFDDRFGVSVSPSEIEVIGNRAEVNVSALSTIVLTPGRRTL
jgi:1,4-alpha-glucan branching enzyme